MKRRCVRTGIQVDKRVKKVILLINWCGAFRLHGFINYFGTVGMELQGFCIQKHFHRIFRPAVPEAPPPSSVHLNI